MVYFPHKNTFLSPKLQGRKTSEDDLSQPLSTPLNLSQLLGEHFCTSEKIMCRGFDFSIQSFAFFIRLPYLCSVISTEHLQGRVQFPIGGRVREPSLRAKQEWVRFPYRQYSLDGRRNVRGAQFRVPVPADGTGCNGPSGPTLSFTPANGGMRRIRPDRVSLPLRTEGKCVFSFRQTTPEWCAQKYEPFKFVYRK